LPESKLDRQPWLRRLYAGYAFSLDCREARGHAYMLYDQSVTERVTQRPQAGACLHCHASATAMYRRVGLGAMGLPAGEEQLADVFEAQRKAMWRLDYISSENSRGFHADQKSARILGESIDYSRQAQALALRLRAPAAPNTQNLPKTPVVGISEGAGPTE
jgi:formate-dependent nitrite reductase cytochrome c552 subunit